MVGSTVVVDHLNSIGPRVLAQAEKFGSMPHVWGAWVQILSPSTIHVSGLQRQEEKLISMNSNSRQETYKHTSIHGLPLLYEIISFPSSGLIFT